jgi:energy-coupling factor transport system substrate-specific component
MFAAGWVGLSAGWLPNLRRWPRAELIVLAAFGVVWGFLFGALMNLWFWPYLAVEGVVGWQPGLALWEGLRRYAVFYLTTSLWWDLGRAGGNALLILLFGRSILRLLRRFQRRFQFAHLG